MIDTLEKKTPVSTIPVALVLHDMDGVYSRHAAVVMASIFANTKSSVCIYVVHDDSVSEENKSRLQTTALSFEQEIKFLDAEKTLDKKKFNAGRLAAGGSRGKLLKLLIPELIEEQKVIYLDCDIVVNLDIKELWHVDIDNCAIGAGLDACALERKRSAPTSWRRDMAYKAMGIDKDSYFNSGVLLMNLEKIRTGYDFLAQITTFYEKYKKITTFTDQDCFNYIFAQDVQIFAEKFNRIELLNEDGQTPESCIWHMAGEKKPWNFYTRPGIDELYWHYLTMTPWGKEKNDLIVAILEGFNSSSFNHLHSSDCVRRLKGQIADNIFKAHVWMIPRILFHTIYRKISKQK